MEFFALLVVVAIGVVAGKLHERKAWQEATGKNRASDV